MSLREGLLAARSHIAWILALALSTAVIVRLEQLEVGAAVPAQGSAATATALGELHRLASAGTLSPETAAALLIAARSGGGLTAEDMQALAARAQEDPAVAAVIAPLLD